tara:strand:- start:957 stop:1124 length:168 start_codon:yes stop_codon:yes gene_type:complete
MPDILFFLLLAAVIAGAMYSSYKLGKRDGTVDTVEYLLDLGKLDANDEELFVYYD